jgi:N-acetylneuraminic acid mutarotase
MKILLHSGDEIELHDRYLEEILTILRHEREALVKALYDLYIDQTPENLRAAKRQLEYHRRL